MLQIGCDINRATRIEPGETHLSRHVHREKQQAPPVELSGQPLEAGFRRGAGQHAHDIRNDTRHAAGAALPELHANITAHRHRVLVKKTQRLIGRPVGRCNCRTGMPSQFNRIKIAVLQNPFFRCAEKFGQGVVQDDPGYFVKKIRITHIR